MKICLINPPFSAADSVGASASIEAVLNKVLPLGIAYIAAVLGKHNYNVKVIDCTINVSHSELIKLVKKESPDVVGITATTPIFESAKRVAEDIKKIFPATVIVIGGCHVTALPEKVISFGYFDVGVIGEGDITFLEIVRQIESRGLKNLDSVQGIVFKNNGKIIVTPPRQRIENLDEIPFPARYLFPPLKEYSPTPASYLKLPVGVLMTSRGCPFQCTFCDRAIFGNVTRQRSVKNVADEIEELINVHGARELRFFDDTFTLKKKFVYELCDELKARKVRIPWSCLTAVAAVTKDLLKKMKDAGCWQVLYGLESGDARMLKLLKKGNTVEQNERAVKWAHELGLSVRADFIVGTPGETMESLERSLDFAKRLPLDYAHFNKFTPFPGTEIYKNLVEKGNKFDFSKPCSILDHSALLYVPETLDKEEYRKFLDRAFKEFYLRPSYILRRLTQIKSFDQFKGQVKGFYAIMGL
ncbi:MAG: radical SAM protein [bacterium]